MTRHLRLVVTILAALAAAPAAAQETLVIAGASVIDPAAAPPVTVQTIVVRDGRIAAIGAGVTAPPRARVIDGRGKFVVAGLWDMHAHLAAVTPIGQAPERYVGHGVLYLRDMGGFLDQLLSLRNDVLGGRRIGPDLVVAGPTLNSDQPAEFHRKVTTAAEARVAVSELKARGVDFIKIHRATNPEVFHALVDETRKAGLPLSGHVPLSVSWIEASQSGMRSIEHIQAIFENLQPDLAMTPALFDQYATKLEGALGDEIFAMLKAHGTYFDPTLVGYEVAVDGARPEAAIARRRAYVRMKTIAGRAARAGVAIVTGTDVFDRHGEMLLQELERLVEIGMTPQQVLVAATTTSAAAAGRPEFGRLAVDGPASFLVLDANPLEDIRHVRQLSAVMLRGRLLDGGRLRSLKR